MLWKATGVCVIYSHIVCTYLYVTDRYGSSRSEESVLESLKSAFHSVSFFLFLLYSFSYSFRPIRAPEVGCKVWAALDSGSALASWGDELESESKVMPLTLLGMPLGYSLPLARTRVIVREYRSDWHKLLHKILLQRAASSTTILWPRQRRVEGIKGFPKCYQNRM